MPIQQQRRQEQNQCGVCGLHYKTEEHAQKCHEWCASHLMPNVDIIKEAIENQKQ